MSDGRIIVLTGATSGIGRALVPRLADSGHTVVGCGRSDTAVEELKTAHPEPHRFDAVDVSDWDRVREWSESVLRDVGPPDLLINNAGLINRNAPLWEVPAEEFSRVMRVNVDGTANLIRAFVPAMIRRSRGVIVNMSSGWGRSTAPEVAPYCASKWAIEGLTDALAQELPPGVGAVAVNPGVIDTDMLRSCWGDGAAAYPSPDAWAERAAGFLLSLTASDNGKSMSV